MNYSKNPNYDNFTNDYFRLSLGNCRLCAGYHYNYETRNTLKVYTLTYYENRNRVYMRIDTGKVWFV